MDYVVTSYKAHPITLNPDNGQFQTVIDDDPITAETLADLKARIDKIDAAALDAARKAQRPVDVLVLMAAGVGRTHFKAYTIVGIHAGRTSRKTLRVLVDGKKASLELGYADELTVIHPRDPRAARVKAHLQAINVARVNLAAAEESFKDFQRTLPSVEVPTVATKEEAPHVEPAFLARIQAAIDQALTEQADNNA